MQLEAFRLEPLRGDHGLEGPVLPQLLVLLVGQPARHLHASRTMAWVWRAVPCTANAQRHAVCTRVRMAGGARGAWKADQSGTPSLIARNFCSRWILAWAETLMYSRGSDGIRVSRGWRKSRKLTCARRVRGLGAACGRVGGRPHPRPLTASQILAPLSGKAHLAGARREGLLRSMALPVAGGVG